MQIGLLSFPGGIWAIPLPTPPPAPVGVDVGLFHHYWAPEAERTIYIFIFKASVGYKLVTFKLQPLFFKFPLF